MDKIYPQNYLSILDLRETEKAIKIVKDFFENNLADALNLKRVTAPLFVKADSGINDDLNGIEKPVSFNVKDLGNEKVEIVQSLAKWKRLALAELQIYPGEGLYTDMNAIRPDEQLDNIHSIYVDQWDWELSILEKNRNLDFLVKVVKKIYRVLKRTEMKLVNQYPEIGEYLPNEITFFHSEELIKMYPNLSSFEREKMAVKKHGAIFIIGIGAELSNGLPHDGRAPDYDDWITENGFGKGLNGDIVVWNPVLERPYELSSMGIRVSPASLKKQLAIRNAQKKENLYFHKKLINGELPFSIGGGIGQSRLCTYFLRKAHIGEIQVGIWSDKMREQCIENGINLL